MLSLSEDTKSGAIEAFTSTSGYLDDLLSIDNNFFDRRSGGSVVDNTLAYQTRDCKARSIARFYGLSDETLNRDPASA